MEYNTSRTALRMPEYGRMVQSLVERCKETADKEERTKLAHAIIEFMRQRNAFHGNGPTEPEKLWDHLFILAEFELDVDSPYPIITEEELRTKPKKLEYPKLQGDYKFYGKSILSLIDIALNTEEGEDKNAMIESIANNMKKSYNIYNKDNVKDEVIFRHLNDLSDGKLDTSHVESLHTHRNYQSSPNQNNRNRNQNNQNRNPNQNQKNSNQGNSNINLNANRSPQDDSAGTSGNTGVKRYNNRYRKPNNK